MSGWNNLYDMFTPPKLSGKEWIISIVLAFLIIGGGFSAIDWVGKKLDPPEARQKREQEQKLKDFEKLKQELGQ